VFMLLLMSELLESGEPLLGFSRLGCKAPCVPGEEEIMSDKEHGTSHGMVQSDLRWGCDRKIADRICNFNRKLQSVLCIA
jgi:hypothetical protein